METKGESPHIGRAGDGAESHPVRRETRQPISHAGETEKTAPQADSTGERAKDEPGRPDDVATSKKKESNTELEPLNQILLARERHRREKAERDAAWARDKAERDVAWAREKAKQDVAWAKTVAGMRADFAELKVMMAQQNRNMPFMTVAAVAILGSIELCVGS